MDPAARERADYIYIYQERTVSVCEDFNGQEQLPYRSLFSQSPFLATCTGRRQSTPERWDRTKQKLITMGYQGFYDVFLVVPISMPQSAHCYWRQDKKDYWSCKFDDNN